MHDIPSTADMQARAGEAAFAVPHHGGVARTPMSGRRIELVAVMTSVVLTLWLLYLDNVINDDSVLYLKSAEAFARGDWHAAVGIYNWPFYSMLIAAIHLATGLDIDIAAYALNGVLYGVLVWAYLGVVRLCGADRRTLWLAALFILLLPSLNDYRTFIVRDIGFWTCYLLGLWALLKFQARPRLLTALAWGGIMVLATLFRIEGIAFLIVLPLVLLWRPPSGYRRALLRFACLQMVLAAGIVAVVLWFAVAGPNAFSGRLLEPLQLARMFGDQLSSGLLEKAAALREHVLVYHSRNAALSGVLAILTYILLSYVAKSLGLLGWISLGAGLKWRAFPFTPTVRRTLTMAAVLNAVVLVIFLVPQFFLTGRYVMPLTLTLGLCVPFGLSAMYRRWRERRDRRAGAWLFPIAMLLLAFMAVDSLWSFGASKNHLKEAGLWLRTNTPATARIYSNDTVVGFYAHKSGDEWKRSQPPLADALQPDALTRYDYVVVSVKRHDAIPAQLATVHPVREFKNRKNDRTLVFGAAEVAQALPRPVPDKTDAR